VDARVNVVVLWLKVDGRYWRSRNLMQLDGDADERR